MSRRTVARWSLLLALAQPGCTVFPPWYEGRPCSSTEPCGGQTICDPVRHICVAPSTTDGTTAEGPHGDAADPGRDARTDSSTDGPPAPDTLSGDLTYVLPEATALCTSNASCTPAGPCQVGTCDPVKHVCLYALAPSTTVCRAAAGACDAAESCTGSSVACPSDAFSPSSTVCRASAGACDVAESCTGSSAACPSDAFSPSSTVCRPASGTCDVAESCTGSSAACPSDSKLATKSSTFSTTWGYDGFVGSDGGLGYQRVEACCWTTGTLTRGFVSFDTSGLPDTATVLGATLTACAESANGSSLAQLYKVTFTPLLDASDYNAPATYLQDLANGSGSQTYTVATSSVELKTHTQYSVRWPVTSCPSSWSGRRWSSSTGPANSACAASTPWTLTVSYCAP